MPAVEAEEEEEEEDEEQNEALQQQVIIITINITTWLNVCYLSNLIF